ncbi:MAG: hypothetical protein E7358_03440 [Clostridiales bacterium]|nr:hypothetical protein [Clostridiales bacterium]
MEKIFYADLEYNRQKRRSAITLSALLIVVMIGSASIFMVKQDIPFSIFFLLFTLIPILLIPASFKNFPVDGKPVLIIGDKEVTVMGKTVKLKDISSFRATITLPASKLDSENIKTLEEFRNVRPHEDFDGDIDIFYVDEKGKKQTLYSHVQHVVLAHEALIDMGIKKYSMLFSIKKNVVKSEFDFKTHIANERQAENANTSKKSKTKQLL